MGDANTESALRKLRMYSKWRRFCRFFSNIVKDVIYADYRDSVIIARMLKNFKYNPDKTDSVLSKYKRNDNANQE